MLSADFGHLERDTRMVDASAAEWVHIDVMDGVFVPNISFGFPVLKAIRKATAKFLDVHLMIVSPEKYVARFAEAGADLVTFHLEATDDPAGCVALIRRAGAKAGVSIKPATPVEALREVLPLVDLVLVMSVEPGFGGQSFIPGSLEKIAAAGDGPGDGSRNDHRGRWRHLGPQRRSGLRGGRRRAGGRQQRFRSRRSAGRGREDAQRLTGGSVRKSAGDFISEKTLRQRPACRAVSASSRRRSRRRSASSRNHSAP